MATTSEGKICVLMETHFDFDLVVSATQDFDGAVRPPLAQIPGTIHFGSIIVRQNK